MKYSLAYVKIINKDENSCFLKFTIYTTLIVLYIRVGGTNGWQFKKFKSHHFLLNVYTHP